jgi:hypothetical protein
MNGLQDVLEEDSAPIEAAAALSLSLSLSLSIEQKEQFLRDGVLVVENVLSKDEIQKAINGMNETLSRHGVNVDSLINTSTSDGNDDDDDEIVDVDEEDSSAARALQKLSTTNGSGGVLDIFYDDWKLDICQNENLFQITTQLWEAGCCSEEEKEITTNNNNNKSSSLWWSPYGSFDYSKGYMYIDRICYRLPTKVAEKLGEKINGDRKKKKSRSIQRSLTPHLDCCPDDKQFDHTTKTKWRPIQCFISLTDNLEPNTGGFEAAKGFHKEFQQWSKTRVPTIVVQKNNNNIDGSSRGTETTEIPVPAACVGEYTHMRPKEDRDVMDRVCHIPVSAGSAVFWDNRIPHSNAYKHNGTIPRAVVYCSFLPDVELNRQYVQNQLLNYKQNIPVKDQWNHISENAIMDDEGVKDDQQKKQYYNFTSLGRKLMGIDSWI